MSQIILLDPGTVHFGCSTYLCSCLCSRQIQEIQWCTYGCGHAHLLWAVSVPVWRYCCCHWIHPCRATWNNAAYFFCQFTHTHTHACILTYLLKSPSGEADRFSASQEIPPHIMEPEVSLPHLQEPATCPYSEPDQSSPCPPSHFPNIYLNIILPSMPESSKCFLSHTFHTYTYTHTHTNKYKHVCSTICHF